MWSWTLYGALQTCRHVGVRVLSPWLPRKTEAVLLEQTEKEEGDTHLAGVQTGKVQ